MRRCKTYGRSCPSLDADHNGTHRACKVLHRLWKAAYSRCHCISHGHTNRLSIRQLWIGFAVSRDGRCTGLRLVLEAHRCCLFYTSIQRSCPASGPGLNLRGTLMQYKTSRPALGGLPEQTYLKQLQPFLPCAAFRPASRTYAATPASRLCRLQAPSHAQQARQPFAQQQTPP